MAYKRSLESKTYPVVSPPGLAGCYSRVLTGSGKPRNLRRPFPVRENRHFALILETSGKMKNCVEKSGEILDKWSGKVREKRMLD